MRLSTALHGFGCSIMLQASMLPCAEPDLGASQSQRLDCNQSEASIDGSIEFRMDRSSSLRPR